MIEPGPFWMLTVLLGIGTFLIRFSFLGLLGGRSLPASFRLYLRYVGVAVFPALFTPLLLWPAATGGETDPIRLIAADGAAVEIGHVEFMPDGDGARIDVHLDSRDFSDEFLSMRPFRCLSRPERMWCHLAYPYAIENRVTLQDLADLEYRLLFLWRPYDKVGVDAWNGLYFKLAPSADGGLDGTLHEADFNILAVPPEAGVQRPVRHEDLSRAEPGQYGFERIEIR